MTSNLNFKSDTTATEVAKVFASRIHGKTVLITGVSPRGLGEATAYAIASQHPRLLIITYRSKGMVDKVVTELTTKFPTVSVQILALNLSSLRSIRSAAEELDSLTKHIDVLINNAGIMSVQERTLNEHGIETHFATNHIGHFLFTNLIMSKLLAAAQRAPAGATRVVNLSGGWHQFGPVRFDDINFDGKPIPPEQEPNRSYLAQFQIPTEGRNYIPEVAYAQSKTANILFSVYLTRHLNQHGILSFSLNPGGIHTEIGRHLPPATVEKILASGLCDKNQDQGSSTTIVAAFDPALTAASSPYLHDCQLEPPMAYANDSEIAERLWHLSEELVGEKFTLKNFS